MLKDIKLLKDNIKKIKIPCTHDKIMMRARDRGKKKMIRKMEKINLDEKSNISFIHDTRGRGRIELEEKS